MAAVPFDDFLASLGRIGEAEAAVDPTMDVISAGAGRIQALPVIDIVSLTGLVVENPEWVRVLGLAVGLGQEQLQITLHHRFSTRSYRVLVAAHAREVVLALDELGLIQRIQDERSRVYSYGDVLLERYGSRARAGRAITRGRALEDAVETVVRDLRLPHSMRTRFVGQGGRSAPCDLAIPAGEDQADIVVGIKGFNSTGSKLTDARREVEEMADTRLPRQFVLAVIDGLGWRSRQADLRAIHELWSGNRIDGVYTQSTLNQFRVDVERAAQLRGVEQLR